MPEKKELQKTISGKFSIKDAKLIDDALKDLGINKNQMVHEAVNLWLQFRPTIKQFQNTKLLNVMKKLQEIQLKIINSPQMKKELDKVEKDFDPEEIELLNRQFGIIEKRAKEVSRKKKQGRPSTKKKRIKRIK